MMNDMHMSHALDDDELDSVSGGKSLKIPAPLYKPGEWLRIRAYDNNPAIIRVRGGSVNKMQYKNHTWQYRLDTGWGFSTDWYNEDELGPHL